MINTGRFTVPMALPNRHPIITTLFFLEPREQASRPLGVREMEKGKGSNPRVRSRL